MHFQLLDETDFLSADTVNEKLNLLQKWLITAYNWLIEKLPSLIGAVIIFFIGWWAAKLICKIFVKALKKGKADATVISFLHSILNTVLKILVIICVLSTLGFDVTALIATLSAAAVTAALALKDSLADVASGTLIIINKKFKVGDFLETDGLKGKVIKIEMMYTTLCTYDNKEIMIPNSRLAANNITNYFIRNERRIEIIVPIEYSQDIETARKVIMNEIKSHPHILQDANNKVAVCNFNESSVDLRVWIWCKSEHYWDVTDDMYENIKNAFDKNNIVIPFNQLDLHMIEETKNTLTLQEKKE